MSKVTREITLFAGLLGLMAIIWTTFGSAYTLRMSIEAMCYAMLALGLTIQWGYAGLFNVGVMGFVAVGAFTTVILCFPINADFWNSDNPAALGGVLLRLAVGVVIVFAVSRIDRIGASRKFRNWMMWIAIAVVYLTVSSALDPVARNIEETSYFVGGLGLPVWIGWIAGGLMAGVVAWLIGHICLGLRSDYLAIATVGIAEIIKTLLKNADWLTKGTLTVSPLPWPVPTPNDVGFIAARAGYLSITAAMVVVIYLLVERAYKAPWGRMMRSIRDNEIAAESMGKDVNRRRLEIFILGNIFIGIGGAALVTSVRIFDPSGFIPLYHTFLVWVMVILGGSGNNRGAIFGAVFVYILWTMSEPVAIVLFDYIEIWGRQWFDWDPPRDLDSRALSMRVFVIGLAIVLVLRYAPKGLIPEEVIRHGGDDGDGDKTPSPMM